MFEFLDVLGNEISSRYQTVVRDIKSKSNSFYDAYLDLQEAFVKTILKEAGYPLDNSKNSGYLLHGQEVKSFFEERFGVPPALIEKLHDHTQKANRHKHQKEKTITLDSVHAFMEPFYVFSRLCLGLSTIGRFAYDSAYFADLFGALEKENRELMTNIRRLMDQAETMAASKKITDEELNACRGLVASLRSENDDLESENEQIRRAITFLQSITAKRMDRLEQQVEELDKKVASILNQKESEKKPVTKSGYNSSVVRAASPSRENAMVEDFFRHARIYFMDSPRGRTNIAQGRMMRRGIACGVAGLLTSLVTLFLPGAFKLFCFVGILMSLYGMLMFLIGFKTSGYAMQDPSEFWIMARATAVRHGKKVTASFFPARWKWITTLMFVLSLAGILGLLFAVSLSISPSSPDIRGSVAIIQSVASMIVLIICIAVTGRSYSFQYVVFQYNDSVIRFDRITGQWTARDKKLGGYRL